MISMSIVFEWMSGRELFKYAIDALKYRVDKVTSGEEIDSFFGRENV
jgi:hypothetical protein